MVRLADTDWSGGELNAYLYDLELMLERPPRRRVG